MFNMATDTSYKGGAIGVEGGVVTGLGAGATRRGGTPGYIWTGEYGKDG